MFKRIKQLWDAAGNQEETDAILTMTKDISAYWRMTDNFHMAHRRYLQDLDFKHQLLLGEENIEALTSVLLTGLISMGLTQANTTYIFAQFVYFHIFGGNKPNGRRHDDDHIYAALENMGGLLVDAVPYQFKGFKCILSNKIYKPIPKHTNTVQETYQPPKTTIRRKTLDRVEFGKEFLPIRHTIKTPVDGIHLVYILLVTRSILQKEEYELCIGQAVVKDSVVKSLSVLMEDATYTPLVPRLQGKSLLPLSLNNKPYSRHTTDEGAIDIIFWRKDGDTKIG